ncbi:Protein DETOXIFICATION 40 [Camellia lanceoleosa]|uniref:Protein DETOXIFICATION 40 n=1 Tax=Camellia lanceoleosa TaxID=1840588 RepID=A0ACC0GQN5_9ERIC|nr:Protein DETOXIFICATION 40 [Camellia lanceoleosa]
MSESKEQSTSTPEPVSSALEEVLSDTSLSCLQRLQRATIIELNTLFKLAAPAIVVYLLNNVTSMATQIFCGHLGNLELAAASLGNNGIQIFAYGVMDCTGAPAVVDLASEDGYSGVEVRVTPIRTKIIIRATRTQNVLDEKGRRIRELTSVVQKCFKFPEGNGVVPQLTTMLFC